MRRHIRHEPMCTDTLMKYMAQLTKLVETKISKVLPKTIALVFDGWSQCSTHYIAVYASFPSKNDNRYDTRLLAISLLEDETSLNAEEHHQFLTYVLEVFGLS